MNLEKPKQPTFWNEGNILQQKMLYCTVPFPFFFFVGVPRYVPLLQVMWFSLFKFFFVKLSWQKKKLKIYVLKGKRYSKYVHELLYGKPLTYKDLYAIHHMYSSIVTVGQGFFSLFYFTCQALILFGLLTQHMVIQILNFDQNHCLF